MPAKISILSICSSALDQDSPSLPGAICLSTEDLTRNSKQIPRDREIILYCSCPNEAASASAALRLKSLGITQVRPLLGVPRRGIG